MDIGNILTPEGGPNGAKRPGSDGVSPVEAKAGASKPAPEQIKPRQGGKRISWSERIEGPDLYGFFKLSNTPLRTMDERQYEAIISDEAQWQRLRERMDADFQHELEMFPFGERDDERVIRSTNIVESASLWLGNWLKASARKYSDIELPRRYYYLTRQDIEKRFPGGRTPGEPGDGDIRDQLSAFRQLFRENLAHYIFTKRSYQGKANLSLFAFVAVILAIVMPVSALLANTLARSLADAIGWTPFDGGFLMLIVLPSLMLMNAAYKLVDDRYRRESAKTFEMYSNSQTESCKTLDKQAALRTKNLSNLIVTMTSRIDKDQSSLHHAEKAEEWPERSYRWFMIVYWLGRRLEYLEQFTQLQIWLVRRTHYFYRLVAVATNNLIFLAAFSLLTAAAALVSFGILSWATVDLEHFWSRFAQALPTIGPSASSLPPNVSSTVEQILAIGDKLFYGLACAYGFFLLYRNVFETKKVSGKEWNTSLELIQQNLDVNNWDRFHNVNLPHLMASQVKSDKSYILQRESWVAGKNR